MDELKVLEWFNEEEVRTGEVFAKHLMDWLAHVWIEVHWINEINIGIFLGEVLHSCYHANEAVTKVLASVACDEDELLTFGS